MTTVAQVVTDAKAAQAKTWQRETYTQMVQPHGNTDQQETEYAVVKNADMDPDMQQHAVDCVAFAFDQRRVLDDIAEIIKTEFDQMYLPTWHCIVGRGMGSYVTHQSKCFIFMYWGEVGILLWRTENESANINHCSVE